MCSSDLVLTIVGLAGAAIVALTAGPVLAPGLEDWLTSDIAADDLEEARLWGYVPYDIAASAMAYLGLFIITLIVLSIISHYIAKSVHAVGLGPVDRSLGVVFGLVRGFILIGLLYLPFHILMNKEEKEDWFGTSFTKTYVEYSSEMMLSFMPESWTRNSEGDESDEMPDPLKDLTGENDDPDIGTDEDAAEEEKDDETSMGYDDMERQAIDALIENQEKMRDLIRDRNDRETSPPNE